MCCQKCEMSALMWQKRSGGQFLNEVVRCKPNNRPLVPTLFQYHSWQWDCCHCLSASVLCCDAKTRKKDTKIGCWFFSLSLFLKIFIIQTFVLTDTLMFIWQVYLGKLSHSAEEWWLSKFFLLNKNLHIYFSSKDGRSGLKVEPYADMRQTSVHLFWFSQLQEKFLPVGMLIEKLLSVSFWPKWQVLVKSLDSFWSSKQLSKAYSTQN